MRPASKAVLTILDNSEVFASFNRSASDWLKEKNISIHFTAVADVVIIKVDS